MKRRLFVCILSALTCIAAWGAKAYPFPVQVEQADGTILTIRIHGDEHMNYVTTTDGVLLSAKDNSYYIATIDSYGNLTPSNILAHNAGLRTQEEIQAIGLQDRSRFYNAPSQKPRRERIEDTYSTTTLFPHTGTPTALVILADFKDQKFKHSDEDTRTIFNLYLNSTSRPTFAADTTLNKNYGSVKMYFNEMSKGLFVPHFDIGAVVHLADSMKVYGPGKDDDMDKFITEACDSALNAGVDFSLYDANEDGYVDLVYVIFAGYGQSTGGGDDTIWPKSGSISLSKTYNGKSICRFGVHSELNFNPVDDKRFYETHINGIGLFCHEFSHCMGLPDFYPTEKQAQNAGNPAMEYWDIMDGGEYTNNGYRPTAYTAWEREYMGWFKFDTLTIDNIGQQIELQPIDMGGKAYRILKDGEASGNEYVFLENIQPYRWNYALGIAFGSGMLVTHVDFDKTLFSINYNAVNNTIGHSRMTIIPADNEYISFYHQGKGKPYTQLEYQLSHGGDPYPGTSDVTQIESFNVYSGSMNKSLVDITETIYNKKVNFVSFYYMVPPPPQKDGFIVDETKNETADVTEIADVSSDAEYTETLDADGRHKFYHFPTFNNLFFLFNSALETPYERFHLNIYVKKAITLKIAFPEPEEPLTSDKMRRADVYGYDFELKAGEWNAIDFELPVSTPGSIALYNMSEEPSEAFIGTVQLYSEAQGTITTIAKPIMPEADKLKAVYSLDGRFVGCELSKLKPGIYIMKGRKIVKR